MCSSCHIPWLSAPAPRCAVFPAATVKELKTTAPLHRALLAYLVDPALHHLFRDFNLPWHLSHLIANFPIQLNQSYNNTNTYIIFSIGKKNLPMPHIHSRTVSAHASLSFPLLYAKTARQHNTCLLHTKYYKLNGLKQHNVIILWFCKTQINTGLTRLKSRC